MAQPGTGSPAPDRLPVYAIVPARGGSKGLPGKNLRMVGDRSLIEHAIDAGRGADSVNEVFVTSEDADILEAGRAAGATVIERPAALATDETATDPVLAHALDWIKRDRGSADCIVVLLQPTSPLRRAHHVEAAVTRFVSSDALGLVSVVEPDKHPLKAMLEGDDGYLRGAYSADAPYRRRQDLPRALFPNGAIYVFSSEAFRSGNCIPRNKLLGMEMTAEESVDIDRADDLARAESLLNRKENA